MLLRLYKISPIFPHNTPYIKHLDAVINTHQYHVENTFLTFDFRLSKTVLIFLFCLYPPNDAFLQSRLCKNEKFCIFLLQILKSVPVFSIYIALSNSKFKISMADFKIQDGVAIIPEGTEEINSNAFYNCKRLTIANNCLGSYVKRS